MRIRINEHFILCKSDYTDNYRCGEWEHRESFSVCIGGEHPERTGCDSVKGIRAVGNGRGPADEWE